VGVKKFKGIANTIRFPIGKAIPVQLVKKIVKFRIEEKENKKNS